VAAAVYAVLALVMFGQGLLPGRILSSSDQLWTAAPWAASAPILSTPFGANPETNDAVIVFEPFLEETRERLPHPPLWNSEIMAGRPFLADAQSAVLSPFSIPAYVLPRRVSPATAAALKIFVAALGTFLVARAIGAGFPGALIAGLIYGFGQSSIVWVTWPQAGGRALLPWLLLLTEYVIRRPRALSVAGLAVVVALQYFAGHPETSYDVLGVAVAYGAFRMVERRRVGRSVARPALAIVVALVAGTGLAAVVILPFVELLLHSIDLESRKALGGAHISPEFLLGLVMPSYWGRPTQMDVSAGTLVVDRAFYVGALPLLLAVASLMRPTIRRVGVGLAGAGALAVVVGFEPFISIAGAFPGPVRTDRLTFLFVFAVALLAGRGLDDLIARRVEGTGWRVLMTVGVSLALLPLLYVAIADGLSDHFKAALAFAWGFHTPVAALVPEARDAVTRVGALLEWLPFAAAAVALLALHRWRGLGRTAFVTLAVALTAVDLFKISMGFNPAVTTAQGFQPTTGGITYLQRSRPDRFAGVDPGLVTFVPPLPANVGMRYDIPDARGRDFPVIDRFATLWGRNIAPVLATPHFDVPRPDGRALRALGLLSVAHLIQDPRSPPLEDPDLTLVYDEGDARIYRNERALPRAFLVDRQRVARTEEQALDAIEMPGVDLRAVVVTERLIPGVATGEPEHDKDVDSAVITSYEPERVVVQAEAARPSILVLTDSYFPGWNAEIDGEPTDIHRVNYLLRGVRVPAGTHQIVFRYQPSSFRWGLVLTLATLLLLLVAVVTGRSRAEGRE
jgi:hypothetical protein